MIELGVYPDLESPNVDGPFHPSNLSVIQERMSRRRDSLPLISKDESFEKFLLKSSGNLNHTEVMIFICPLLLLRADIRDELNIAFTNMEKLSDDLKRLQPNSYHGATPSDVEPSVRATLSRYIEPSKNTSLPCLPNFFFEWSGQSENSSKITNQALYDGAIGERAMLKTLLFANNRNDPCSYNAAHTMAATYHSATSNLSLYCTHAVLSNEGSVKYRQTYLAGYTLRDGMQQWIDGTTALSNLREWAKEERDKALVKANVKMVLLEPASSREEPRIETKTKDEEKIEVKREAEARGDRGVVDEMKVERETEVKIEAGVKREDEVNEEAEEMDNLQNLSVSNKRERDRPRGSTERPRRGRKRVGGQGQVKLGGQ